MAGGAEDYYLGAGEAPGRWLGAGADRFGLGGPIDGTVGADELRGLLAGQDPNNPIVQLVRAGTDARPRTAGFDLTFSAPKSVSLLYGLGDTETAGAVTGAHDRAVAEAVAYLEGHATFTRRRVNGDVQRVAGVGLTVAAFSHRTSRAGDPQLHTHCLAVNMVESVDGTWGALDGRVTYRHAKTAGYVYQAVLRGELSRTLGVAWEPVHNGHADVAGVGRPLIDSFSKRREQIVDALDEVGQTSRAAAEVAALDTRPAKADLVDPVGLRDRWAAEARSLGVDPDRFADRLARRAPPAADEAALAERFVGPAGLTRRRATFDRRDIVQAWCQQAPAGAGIDAGRLDAYTARLQAHQSVVALAGSGGERRWSTVEMLATEAAVIDRAARRRSAGVGIVAEPQLDAVLAARPRLNDGQRAMVRTLCRSGAGVDLVVGKAGAGKTTALEAAAVAWRSAGYTVAGTALAARAAAELESGAGIVSATLARMVGDLDASDGSCIDGDTIVVVDEAAMVSTRDMAALFGWVDRAGAKVVLVGDHHQLPEIDAGGAFRGLVGRLGAAELTSNVRQAGDDQQWERDALDALRSGSTADVAAAVGAYETHGRVTVSADADATRQAMVDDWAAATAAGFDVVMVAVANRDVEDLNRRARVVLANNGQLSGDTIAVAGRQWAAGDETLCVRPDRSLGVINGTTGTIVAVHASTGEVTIGVGDSDTIRIGHRYLSDGHLRHAYASTIHKTQGRTVDVALLYGNDALYRQAGYVAASRGRHHNHIYLTEHADRPGDVEDHGAWTDQTRRPATNSLTQTLTVSRHQQLATDQTTTDQTATGQPGRLAALWADHDRDAAAIHADAPPDPAADLSLARQHTQHAAANLQAARRSREHAEETADAARWRPGRSDRFLARRRLAHTTRTENDAADRHHARQHTQTGLEGDQQTYRQWVADNQDRIDALHDTAAAIGRTARAAARTAETDPTDDLIAAIGPPPADADTAGPWRQAAAALISYQARTGHTDPDLADDAADPALVAHRAEVAALIDQAATELRPTANQPGLDPHAPRRAPTDLEH